MNQTCENCKVLIKEAKATFKYVAGPHSGEITVGGNSPAGKTEDNWKIGLALDAGIEVSEDKNTDIAAISLSLLEFRVSLNKSPVPVI